MGEVIGTGFEFRVVETRGPGVYVALGLSSPFEGERIVVRFDGVESGGDGRIVLDAE